MKRVGIPVFKGAAEEKREAERWEKTETGKEVEKEKSGER